MSYYDTRLGIVNNWAAPSTTGWNAVDNFALNSVFTNFFNQFSANALQAGDSASQLSGNLSSNPFSFGNLASSNWSFPQTNWSLASTSSGGDWFSNALGSLGSGMSWGVQGGSNSGPIDVPSYISQNNRNKIFGSGNIQPLNPEMQARVIELMKRAHARGIDFEISEGYRPKEVEDARRAAAKAKNDGSEKMYAKGRSQHSDGNAIDIDRRTTSLENLKTIGHIWKYEMGNTYGEDFKDTPRIEYWHCDGRKDITGQSHVAQWTSGRSQSAVAGGGWSSPWGGGLSWSMPSFSSSMGGFGSGFGGSWFNTMFSSSLGGWGGGWNSGISYGKALPSQYADKIQKYSDQFGVDAKFISCLANRESGGDKYAVSRKGATGVMQIMRENWAGLGITDPTDPDQNIRGGVQLIKGWLQKYHGDKRTTLAAYNWGPARVDKLVKQFGTDNYDVIGPYVFSGTQAYVRQIMNRYNSSGGGGQHLST